MTCYLRLHEVLLGVGSSEGAIDWQSVFEVWQRATTVDDRDEVLARMALDPIDVFDVAQADLGRYRGLIVSGRVDQEFLYRERGTIRDFLDAGKVVVFSGELFQPWLPGDATFVPRDVELGDQPVLAMHPHPVFEGVRQQDLGSSFAHGHHSMPAGATVLVSLPGGAPVVYVDQASTRGTILVHAGHTLLGYASAETSAQRIVPQLLDWIKEEGKA